MDSDSSFAPYLVLDPDAQAGTFRTGRPYPGKLSPDGRRVAIADDDGRLRSVPVEGLRIDVLTWRRRLNLNGGDFAAQLKTQIAARLRNIEDKLASIKKPRGAAKGSEAFVSVREALRSDVRTIAELIGDEELARELWDLVPETKTAGSRHKAKT